MSRRIGFIQVEEGFLTDPGIMSLAYEQFYPRRIIGPGDVIYEARLQMGNPMIPLILGYSELLPVVEESEGIPIYTMVIKPGEDPEFHQKGTFYMSLDVEGNNNLINQKKP